MVRVQPGSKLEAFLAAFSRKTRVKRRAVHVKRIGITARKRYMSTPFEGAWTVTANVTSSRFTSAQDSPCVRRLAVLSCTAKVEWERVQGVCAY